jgi:hypothetical protein
MKLEIDIELDDAVAEHLRTHLATMQKPPKLDQVTRTVVIEPRYTPGMEIEQFAGEAITANINATLRDNPTPAMQEHRQAIQAREQQLNEMLAPRVGIRTKSAQ